MNIKQKLLSEAEKDYKKFSSSIIPNIDNVLGVRLPVLRKIAKEFCDEEYLKINKFEYMEEIMLQAMVIGNLKKSPEEIIEYVKDFVPKINNWAVCDTFCCGLKFTKDNKKMVWEFIQPYFDSSHEFEIRFAYVMLLAHFIDEEYIDRVLKLIDKFKDEKYYAKMAAAWATSICFVKFPDKTLNYLKKSRLDNWTFNKSIQKICESYRVSKEMKDLLKTYKR